MNFVRSLLSTPTATPTTPETTGTTVADTPVAVATAVEPSLVVVNDSEPVAESQKPEQKNDLEKMIDNPIKQLDLVFMMDCTGSMGSYIQAGKANIQKIAERLAREENCDVRFAMIAYRDHPPQDSTFVTRVFDFTNDKNQMQKYLDVLSASGGGDGPEAVTAALFEAHRLPWRPNATKLAILIADAPPHGLGESGDGFPNGDPDGHDPLVIAQEMAKKGIIIYPVACEPALSHYKNARAFMVGLAEITEGYATSLASSALLADIILGGTAEAVGLQSLQQQYESEIVSVRTELEKTCGGPVSEEVLTAKLYQNMKEKNVVTKTWHCDGKISDTRAQYFSKAHRLSDARTEIIEKECASADGGSRRDLGFKFHAYPGVMAPAPISTASATSSNVAMEDISYEQVQKIVSRGYKQGKF